MAEQGDPLVGDLVAVLRRHGYTSVADEAIELDPGAHSSGVLASLRNAIVPAVRAAAEAQRILSSVGVDQDVLMEVEVDDDAERVSLELDGADLESLADRLEAAVLSLETLER